jgi:hypothetical protein
MNADMNNDMDPIEIKLQALSLRGSENDQGGKDPCPIDETFAAFMDGLLSTEEAESIREHILRCTDCHLAYTTWMELAKQEDPTLPAHLLESARSLHKPPAHRVIIQLFKKAFEILNPSEDLFLPSLRPDLAAVRGQSGTLPPNHYEIVDIESSLPHVECLRIQHLQDTGTLKLTVIPSQDISQDTLKKIRVDLYIEKNLVQSWPVFGEGTSLNPIDPGLYRLELVEIAAGRDAKHAMSLGFMELELRS